MLKLINRSSQYYTVNQGNDLLCDTESAYHHTLTGFTKTNKGNYVYTPDSTSNGVP
jgi:hypothetical protein